MDISSMLMDDCVTEVSKLGSSCERVQKVNMGV